MKVIEPSVELLLPFDVSNEEVGKFIEEVGRTAYQSFDSVSEDSYERFNKMIVDRKHEAVIEHFSFSFKFTCDRGVSHELVRHRMASYCQESTRYCNYDKDKFGNETTVIKPYFWDEGSEEYHYWYALQLAAERTYLYLLKSGATPQEARSVLTNSLKTTIVMTANLREWRHFFKLRCDKAAHPQMREVAKKALKICIEKFPLYFEDLKDLLD